MLWITDYQLIVAEVELNVENIFLMRNACIQERRKTDKRCMLGTVSFGSF